MKIKGNTILITGGTSGIGLELTKQLLEFGNDVIITGRDQAKLDGIKAQLPKVNVIKSDVSDPKAITLLYENVVKNFPGLNILINNAGIMRKINMHDQLVDLEDITREIETNLNGPIRMVKQFLGHLKGKKEAAILNVSSGLAFVPLPISPIYCATKAAIHSFTLSLRAQLKNTNVKVFELAPPATQTALLGHFDAEDLKGTSIMNVTKMVECAVKGIESNVLEIRPGQSNVLKLMSRVAPQFILNQMSKTVDKMLAKPK
jgi:uncharacterized oxidoreductase